MKMNGKHIFALTAGVLLLSVQTLQAQVEKSVEVTKDYRPAVSAAMKLPVEPDMVDTVKLRPEIDYSITPLMFSTELVTVHNFKPATVTYWDFNRPTNFYVKLGAGMPVNTVADIFMSSHNARTGYIMAAANHHGEFGKIKNWFGDKRTATKASTTGRVAGGVYWGKRMFEGEFAYDSELARRYAAKTAPPWHSRPMAEYEDFKLKMRFGDDFVDLSRTNFDVNIFGTFYHDKSDKAVYANLQQFDFGGGGRLARAFGRHRVEAEAQYHGIRGTKALRGETVNKAKAGILYGYTAPVIDFVAGGYYAYADGDGRGHHRFLPYARILLNVTNNDAVTPFIELDGTCESNDYYSLARRMIYVDWYDGVSSLAPTFRYDLRFGIGGKFGRGRFGYKLYAGLSYAQNERYWYSYNYDWLRVVTANQGSLSLNFELEYRPLDDLILSAGVRGRFFSDKAKLEGWGMANGKAPVEGWLGGRYRHRKFSVGASATVAGNRWWTLVDDNPSADNRLSNVKMPAYVDVSVDFEWNIKTDWRIFVEGSNLANMKIYTPAYYREQGIRFTAGFKFVF